MMTTRLLHSKIQKKVVCDYDEKSNNIKNFLCLDGEDVVTAKVSDHHPIIHDKTLFWNIMMQGKMRKGLTENSYNNGFGIIETDAQYKKRLICIGKIIAEIITYHPFIEVISLCEGPINSVDLNALLHSFHAVPCMKKFFKDSINKNGLYKPSMTGFPNWGLLMMVDSRYEVSQISCDFLEKLPIKDKLVNRFQLWKLKKEEAVKYVALCHLPFSGDENIKDKNKLSLCGKMYCDLINKILDQYSNQELMICGDFNLNPYLINKINDRILDKVENNNSILFSIDTKSKTDFIKSVTVDGILLSLLKKKKYYSSQIDFSLFNKLKREEQLFKQYTNTMHKRTM